jgi:hypothetical protein
MIWELSQDVSGQHSLYKVIEDHFPGEATAIASSLTSPSACGRNLPIAYEHPGVSSINDQMPGYFRSECASPSESGDNPQKSRHLTGWPSGLERIRRMGLFRP